MWLVSAMALGQTVPLVTQADTARLQRAQPKVTEADIARAVRDNPMPTDDQVRRLGAPSSPRIDQLPQPADRRPVDLAAIARGFEKAGAGMPPEAAAGPTLMVFISFSMPERALQQLVVQAEKLRATLVLRGFEQGSLVKTAAHVRRLIGQHSISFKVDPQAFERFAVMRAPTFVLLRADAQSRECGAGTCYASQAFVSTSGDVSIDYALEHIEKTAPAFAKEARSYLKRMGNQP